MHFEVYQLNQQDFRDGYEVEAGNDFCCRTLRWLDSGRENWRGMILQFNINVIYFQFPTNHGGRDT